MSGRVRDGGAWHEGHVLGGYQNPACGSCRAEQRRAEKWQEKVDLDGKPFCPTGYAQRYHAVGECACVSTPSVIDLAVAMNAASIRPEELRLGRDLRPIARRIIDHLSQATPPQTAPFVEPEPPTRIDPTKPAERGPRLPWHRSRTPD